MQPPRAGSRVSPSYPRSRGQSWPPAVDCRRDRARSPCLRADGSEDCCVLISKTELESFERALEILSGSERGLEMHEMMLRIAREVDPSLELSDREPAIAGASGPA